MTEPAPLSIGMCAFAACMFDVMTHKPGNVHPLFAFSNMSATDFLLSAAAIAPAMDDAPNRRVGETILESIQATRRVTGANTNLGIILLLAPLASVPLHRDLRGGLISTLMRLTVDDARSTYEAIRLAKPGGLGTVETQDVSTEPTVTLREAMALAADRDIVARQYVNDFEQVFEGAELLRENFTPMDIQPKSSIRRVFLMLLANYPDSLIARKHGRSVAEEVSRRARNIVESNAGFSETAIDEFDRWLRSGGQYPINPFGVNSYNPGTTADLVTASLFVALRRGIIQLPLSKSASSAE
jgi:triphosphoribosyl-dephospho-CoA synthase